MNNSHKFFRNESCTYFPCHPTDTPQNFNCLFCYCPLYLIPDCGGKATWFKRGENTIKDCSACMRPHTPEDYDLILEVLRRKVFEK